MKYDFAGSVFGDRVKSRSVRGSRPDDPPKGKKKEKELSKQSDEELFDEVEDKRGVVEKKGGQGDGKKQEEVVKPATTSPVKTEEPPAQGQSAATGGLPQDKLKDRLTQTPMTMEPLKADKVLTKEQYNTEKAQRVMNRVRTDSPESVWSQIYNQMRPEWETERADKMRKISKIQALGDALKLGFEGYFGSKGAKIDERRPGDAQTLAYFNQMKDKYEKEKTALNQAMYEEARDRLDHSQEMEKTLTQEGGLNQRKLWDNNTDWQVAKLKEGGADTRNIRDNAAKMAGIKANYDARMADVERQKKYGEDWIAFKYWETLNRKIGGSGKNGPIVAKTFDDMPYFGITDDNGITNNIPAEVYDKVRLKVMNDEQLLSDYKAYWENQNPNGLFKTSTAFSGKDFISFMASRGQGLIMDYMYNNGTYERVSDPTTGEWYWRVYDINKDPLSGTAIPATDGAAGIEGSIPPTTSIPVESVPNNTSPLSGGSGVEIPQGVTGSLYADDEEEQ